MTRSDLPINMVFFYARPFAKDALMYIVDYIHFAQFRGIVKTRRSEGFGYRKSFSYDDSWERKTGTGIGIIENG